MTTAKVVSEGPPAAAEGSVLASSRTRGSAGLGEPEVLAKGTTSVGLLLGLASAAAIAVSVASGAWTACVADSKGAVAVVVEVVFLAAGFVLADGVLLGVADGVDVAVAEEVGDGEVVGVPEELGVLVGVDDGAGVAEEADGDGLGAAEVLGAADALGAGVVSAAVK
jgi:hypothetical protein